MNYYINFTLSLFFFLSSICSLASEATAPREIMGTYTVEQATPLKEYPGELRASIVGDILTLQRYITSEKRLIKPYLYYYVERYKIEIFSREGNQIAGSLKPLTLQFPNNRKLGFFEIRNDDLLVAFDGYINTLLKRESFLLEDPGIVNPKNSCMNFDGSYGPRKTTPRFLIFQTGCDLLQFYSGHRGATWAKMNLRDLGSFVANGLKYRTLEGVETRATFSNGQLNITKVENNSLSEEKYYFSNTPCGKKVDEDSNYLVVEKQSENEKTCTFFREGYRQTLPPENLNAISQKTKRFRIVATESRYKKLYNSYHWEKRQKKVLFDKQIRLQEGSGASLAYRLDFEFDYNYRSFLKYPAFFWSAKYPNSSLYPGGFGVHRYNVGGVLRDPEVCRFQKVGDSCRSISRIDVQESHDAKYKSEVTLQIEYLGDH